MFLVGFFWGAVVGSLVTQLIIYVAVRRHRAKVGTPSASYNRPSDEIAALVDRAFVQISYGDYNSLVTTISKLRAATSHVG